MCPSIINIIAVARDEEALAVSLRSCPARPPLPSPYKEKIPRRVAINGFTPEHLHVGRPLGRETRAMMLRERETEIVWSEGEKKTRCLFPSSVERLDAIGKTRQATMVYRPIYLP